MVDITRCRVAGGCLRVPAVSIGGQETQLFLTRGNWLARKLGLTKARMDILPVSFGFPFGLSVGAYNLPLPSKIVTRVLEPINIRKKFGKNPDIAEVDAELKAVAQSQATTQAQLASVVAAMLLMLPERQ